MQQLIVSLKQANMLKVAQGAAEYDIGDLIGDVPSATIISGDPGVSVHVAVEARYADVLREAVGDLCTVGPYRTFTLLKS